MQRILNITLMIFLIGIYNNSFADNGCASVLVHSQETGNIEQTESRVRDNIDNFCRNTENVSQDTISNDIRVEYEYVTGSVNVDNSLTVDMINEVRAETCSSSGSSEAKSSSVKNLYKKINSSAYQAYSECLSMSSEGLELKVETEEDTNLLLTLSYKSTEQNPPEKIIHKNITGSVETCKWNYSKLGTNPSTVNADGELILQGNTAVSLICSRSLNPQGTVGHGTVSILQNNSGNNLAFTLPWLSLIEQQSTSLLKAEIDNNTSQINTHTGQINTHTGQINTHTGQIDTINTHLSQQAFWKMGNNGTVTCKTWCGSNTCLAGFMAGTSQPIDCNSPGSGGPNLTELLCVCR